MKKILLWLFAVVFVLSFILLVNTHLKFEDQQVSVSEPLPIAPIDQDGAVQRFAKAITYQTISFDDPTKLDPEAFLGLHQHIQESFPVLHQQAEHYTISDYSLVYHVKGSDPSLKPVLYMGHMDVVPVDPGTRDQWLQAPFSGAIVNDVVWGRGTIDDKVTVLALLEAMETLLKNGLKPKRSIYFAFGHDEEIGGEQGAAKIAEHFKDQGLSFEFVLDEGGAITDGIMKGMSQPVAIIGVAEKGFVNLRLTVPSEGGHSSQPPEQTAVGILAQAIVRVENSPFETDLSHSFKTFSHVAHYAPLSMRVPMANLWLLSPLVEQAMLKTPSSAAGIRSTIAPTMLSGSSKSNILPTQASAVVNVRILPGDTVASVKQHFIDVINDPRVEVETFMENEPSQVSPIDSLGYRQIERNIRRMDDNILVAPYLVLGGTDSKHFYGLSENVYRFMMVELNPESLKRFHGVNEQLAVKDYINAVNFFYAMLQESAMQ